MADWSPEPDELADEVQARILAALDRRLAEYFAALFPESFMHAFTVFDSWDAMLRAAQADRDRSE